MEHLVYALIESPDIIRTYQKVWLADPLQHQPPPKPSYYVSTA